MRTTKVQRAREDAAASVGPKVPTLRQRRARLARLEHSAEWYAEHGCPVSAERCRLRAAQVRAELEVA